MKKIFAVALLSIGFCITPVGSACAGEGWTGSKPPVQPDFNETYDDYDMPPVLYGAETFGDDVMPVWGQYDPDIPGIFYPEGIWLTESKVGGPVPTLLRDYNDGYLDFLYPNGTYIMDPFTAGDDEAVCREWMYRSGVSNKEDLHDRDRISECEPF